MEMPFNITLLMVITVMAGITAQVLGDYLKVPSIVFLLLFGILLGPDGFGWLNPHLLGNGLEVIVSLSVALILFEGGLNLELRELGKVSGSLRNLVSIGTLITLIGGGFAAYTFGEFPWPLAFLYAALVVVTGPTVIGPLLKQVQVDRQVAALLEGEGVLIDPVGAILAVLVFDVILNGDADPIRLISGLTIRLGIGSIIGGLGGWFLGWFLKKANTLSEDLKNLVVLAGLWGLYGLAQAIRGESGLMATVIAGMVLSSSDVPEVRALRRFKGQLTILAVSVLFILLAADLSLASVVALGWGSVGTVAFLMFVVRPINVWICTINSGLNWRQKLFVSWIAPKGIVSASVASLFSILLTQKGMNGGDAVKALVFLTIILTVVSQGLTAQLVANWLQLTSTKAKGAVIVGSNPVSRLIARLFKERNESVVLIDTNPEAYQEAQQEELMVFLSSALDVKVLEEAGLGSMGTFLAMTTNAEVNLVLAQRAIEEFQPPRVLAVFPRDTQNNQSNQNSKKNSSNGNSKIQQPFTKNLSLKLWNKYLSNGEIKLGETTMKDPGFAFQQAHMQALIRSEELLPLLREREGQLQVLPAAASWQVGDRIIYLLHSPKPTLLQRLSGGVTNQSQANLTIEKLPKVEEVPMPSAVLLELEETTKEATSKQAKTKEATTKEATIKEATTKAESNLQEDKLEVS